MISKKFKTNLVGRENISKKEEEAIFSDVLDVFLKRNSKKVRQELSNNKHKTQ